MVKKIIENFNISQICDSGQCFRMIPLKEKVPEKDQLTRVGEERENMHMGVIASDRYLEVEQSGNECIFHCTEEEFEEFWKAYFDLEVDYSVYMAQINPNDTYLKNAAVFGSGMRILKQDLWEMIVSFLISQQNNIPRIRKCISNICREYGEERMNFRGEVFYTFPKPEVLAGLDEDALKACNLGYRSKYVVRSARSVVNGEVDLEAIKQMPYKKAKEELLKLFGVGVKVADCICLFALHHLQAFPIDTHINQALETYYKKGFPKRRYKGSEGVLQQYIFYYELMGKPLEKEY